MGLEIRDLITQDLYRVSKILKKVGLRDVSLVKKNEEGTLVFKTTEEMGFGVVSHIIENLYQAENEINELIGSLVGKTAEEAGQMDLIEETWPIIEKLKDNPKLAVFFKLAGQLK